MSCMVDLWRAYSTWVQFDHLVAGSDQSTVSFGFGGCVSEVPGTTDVTDVNSQRCSESDRRGHITFRVSSVSSHSGRMDRIAQRRGKEDSIARTAMVFF